MNLVGNGAWVVEVSTPRARWEDGGSQSRDKDEVGKNWERLRSEGWDWADEDWNRLEMLEESQTAQRENNKC